MLLVEGEQGIGKTSLLRAALAMPPEPSGRDRSTSQASCDEDTGQGSEQFRVRWAAAGELGQAWPLRLISDLLPEALRPDRFALLGGGPLGLAGDPLLAAAEDLIAAVDSHCAQAPLAMVAEDLQWADEASLLVWQRLMAACTQLPLLIIGSCRPGTDGADLGRIRRAAIARGGLLELGPMPSGDLRIMIGSQVGGSPGRRLTELIRRVGGNPLYAVELVDGLVRDGRVRVTGGVAELTGEPTVPASLAATISDRLAQLAPPMLILLRWAAVLGQEFSVTDLELVADRQVDELVPVLNSAMAAGVLSTREKRLAFRHGLIRQVLYEAIPVALRGALHFRAAQRIARAGQAVERVAAQLAAMPEPIGDWVADWLTGSAPTLIYRAPAIAAELLRSAVGQLVGADPRREKLEACLATVSFLLLEHSEAEQRARRLLSDTASADLAAEMAWLLGYTLMRRDRPAEAAEVARAAIARPGFSAGHRARLAALHAMILTMLNQLDEAAAAARQALELASRSGDRLAAGYAWHALSCVSFAEGDPLLRFEHTTAGLAEVGDDPQATDVRVLLLTNRAYALTDIDRTAEAVSTIKRALILGEQMGSARLSMTRTALANLYIETGHWDDALAELEPPTGGSRPIYYQITLHGAYSFVAGHRDDRTVAAAHLQTVSDLQATNLAFWTNSYYLLLARAMAAEQGVSAAAAAAELALCLDEAIAVHMPSRCVLLPTLVRLATAASDHQLARTASQAAQRDAEREPRLQRAAQAARHCRAIVAADAAALLAVAGYYGRTGRRMDQGQALEDYAVVAAAQSDRVAARHGLTGALRLYGELGARWDAARAHDRLRPYRIRAAREAPARPGKGQAALTATESRVADMVAAGMSNSEIAAALFLSRNTVQTHVSHILAKLGARSRAGIVRQVMTRR